MPSCPQCGAEVAADQRFCPQCGTRQPERPAAQSAGATVVLQPPPTQALNPPLPSSDPAEPPPPEAAAQPTVAVPSAPAQDPAPGSFGLPPASYAQPAAPPAPQPVQSKPRWGLILGIIGGLLALACIVLVVGGLFIVRQFGEVVASMTPVASSSGVFTTELLSDDFSSERRSRFIEGADSDGSFSFTGGTYVITLDQPELIMWSAAGETYDDIAIEVDATVEGPPGSAAALLFRYQDEQNFYLLRVYGDGSYMLTRFLDDEPFDLVEFTQSDAINGSGQPNRLRIELLGETIRLYANDQLLTEVTDSSFAEGDVALGISAEDEAGGSVTYDNLVIYGTS